MRQQKGDPGGAMAIARGPPCPRISCFEESRRATKKTGSPGG